MNLHCSKLMKIICFQILWLSISTPKLCYTVGLSYMHHSNIKQTLWIIFMILPWVVVSYRLAVTNLMLRFFLGTKFEFTKNCTLTYIYKLQIWNCSTEWARTAKIHLQLMYWSPLRIATIPAGVQMFTARQNLNVIFYWKVYKFFLCRAGLYWTLCG